MATTFSQNKYRYLSGDSWFCPYCESKRILMGDLKEDHHIIWRQVDCVDCDQQWNEVYNMMDLEEVK